MNVWIINYENDVWQDIVTPSAHEDDWDVEIEEDRVKTKSLRIKLQRRR